LQSLYLAVPGSSNPAHIAENFAVWDFALTESEMKRRAFSQGTRQRAITDDQRMWNHLFLKILLT
jgi:diketogulonate reductase-like aldo/keto reductase